jgi:hypothetical protein
MTITTINVLLDKFHKLIEKKSIVNRTTREYINFNVTRYTNNTHQYGRIDKTQMGYFSLSKEGIERLETLYKELQQKYRKIKPNGRKVSHSAIIKITYQSSNARGTTKKNTIYIDNNGVFRPFYFDDDDERIGLESEVAVFEHSREILPEIEEFVPQETDSERLERISRVPHNPSNVAPSEVAPSAVAPLDEDNDELSDIDISDLDLEGGKKSRKRKTNKRRRISNKRKSYTKRKQVYKTKKSKMRVRRTRRHRKR